jgi:hypothetical protein
MAAGIASLVGDIIATNPTTHSPCAATPPVPVAIVTSLQAKVLFGVTPFAVTGSILTPHSFQVDGSCDPHTPTVTGVGSSKVFMGGFPANRLTDLADGDGVISVGGAIKVNIGG